MTKRGPSRRVLLAGIAGTGASLCGLSLAAGSGPRIVTLEAALTQTALMLSVVPLATTGTDFYRSFVIAPALPPEVRDVGTRAEPNVEFLMELAPEIVFYSPEYGPLSASLSARLNTEAVPIYVPGRPDHFQGAVAAAGAMGERLGRMELARQRIAEADGDLHAMGDALRFAGIRSVCPVSFLSSRHVRLYARASLFGGALYAAGIENAAQQSANRWGFADVGMAALAGIQADLFVHVGPLPPRAEASPVWNALPFVRERRLVAVPTIWMFGGLPSATRFATTLATAVKATNARP